MKSVVLFIVVALAAAAAPPAVQGLPIINIQPEGQTNIAGGTVVFEVDATGDGDLTYQWRKGTANLTDDDRISGATDPWLQIDGVTSSDRDNYSVKITDSAGVPVTSANAYLMVLVPPAITKQPQSKTNVAGTSATFSVTASGTGPLGYQWLVEGVEIPGATNASLTRMNVQAANDGEEYAVVVSNAALNYGAEAAVSAPATLTVLVPPTITVQPQSAVAVQGDQVLFSVDAEGTDTETSPMTYQWRLNGRNLTGETDTLLELLEVDTSDTGAYSVVVANKAGSVVSSNAVLTVNTPPVFTLQPKPRTVSAGTNVTFTAKTTGTPPITYQWLLNDSPIVGATSSNYAVFVFSTSQAGNYSVIASNLVDDVESADAYLTVVAETVKPTVTITSPNEGARWSNAWITVRGKAADNAKLGKVEFQYNGSPFVEATTTNQWTNWLATFPGIGGTNVFRCMATDDSGNRSATATRKLFYVVPSPLTLLTNGFGSVTPSSGGKLLEIGRTYTLAAKPGAGQVFAGWSLGAVSTNPALSFLMRTGLVLQANFITNPYAPVKGLYNGLFYQAAGVTHDTAGFFTLTLTDKGLYTGKLLFGGGSYSFSGGLWIDGNSSTLVPRPGKSLIRVVLHVDLTNGTDSVSGTVSDGVWVAALSGDRLVFNSSRPPPQAGRYTAALVHTTNAPTMPAGDGSGTLTVSPSGLVVFAGKVADGTPVSQSVGLSKNGQWPFFANLYSGKGSMLGWGTFTNRETRSIEGDVSWIKLSAPGRYYTNGFMTEVEMVGSHYAPPARGVRVLNVTTGEVVFTAGGLAAPLTNGVFLTTNNTVTVISGTNRLALRFSLSTGAASGTFIHPVTLRSSVINGVLLPEDNTLRGFFLSTNLSGSVILRPVTP